MHSPGTAMPSTDTSRKPLSVAGDEKRSMPDARRIFAGCSDVPLRRFAFFRVSCRPHGLLGWKALGLSVSTPLLGRADEVIE